MKRLFQKMPEFLKYGAALIAGGFYIWAIIILLNNDNWIGISSITTMFLAIAAFWTIRQNYSFRKREQRQRLLNEIIEWAIDVSKCGIERGYPDISNLIDLYSVWLKISDKIGEIILCFKNMRGQNQYMGKIAESKAFVGPELQKAVETLMKEFEEHIRLLSLCETYMRDREEAWKRTVEHKHTLNFCAEKIIEEAVKIKSELLS